MYLYLKIFTCVIPYSPFVISLHTVCFYFPLNIFYIDCCLSSLSGIYKMLETYSFYSARVPCKHLPPWQVLSDRNIQENRSHHPGQDRVQSSSGWSRLVHRSDGNSRNGSNQSDNAMLNNNYYHYLDYSNYIMIIIIITIFNMKKSYDINELFSNLVNVCSD